MDKIIFLDIDGVLNCDNTFKETDGLRKAYNNVMKNITDKKLYTELRFKEQLLEIDFSKIMLLKELIKLTGAKIVVTSSWRIYWYYPLFEEMLLSLGIPVIGFTKSLKNRGEEINTYVKENNIQNYIILDDEVFSDYEEEQKYNLVRTNYYQDGLNEESVLEGILKLGLKP